jgi:hypothetical protein
MAIEKEKKYSATFSANKAEWKEFLKIASENDVSGSTILRQFIKKYISDHNKNPKS